MTYPPFFSCKEEEDAYFYKQNLQTKQDLGRPALSPRKERAQHQEIQIESATGGGG